jgi:hypothetical protein
MNFKDNQFYRTCVSCKGVTNKVTLYNEKCKCKSCFSQYKKENIECKICNTIN